MHGGCDAASFRSSCGCRYGVPSLPNRFKYKACTYILYMYSVLGGSTMY